MNPINVARTMAVAQQAAITKIQEKQKEDDKKVDDNKKSDSTESDKSKSTKENTQKGTPPSVNLDKTTIIANARRASAKFQERLDSQRGQDLSNNLIQQARQANHISQNQPISSSSIRQGFKDFAIQQVIMLLNDKEFRKKFQNFNEDIFIAAEEMLVTMKKKGGDIKPSDLDSNSTLARVLRDEQKVKQLVIVLQNTTDHFMNETGSLVSDKRASVQQKAQALMNIAQAVMNAEKKARQEQLYTSVVPKYYGVNPLGFA